MAVVNPLGHSQGVLEAHKAGKRVRFRTGVLGSLQGFMVVVASTSAHGPCIVTEVGYAEMAGRGLTSSGGNIYPERWYTMSRGGLEVRAYRIACGVLGSC